MPNRSYVVCVRLSRNAIALYSVIGNSKDYRKYDQNRMPQSSTEHVPAAVAIRKCELSYKRYLECLL